MFCSQYLTDVCRVLSIIVIPTAALPFVFAVSPLILYDGSNQDNLFSPKYGEVIIDTDFVKDIGVLVDNNL